MPEVRLIDANVLYDRRELKALKEILGLDYKQVYEIFFEFE